MFGGHLYVYGAISPYLENVHTTDTLQIKPPDQRGFLSLSQSLNGIAASVVFEAEPLEDRCFFYDELGIMDPECNIFQYGSKQKQVRCPGTADI